MMNYEIFKEVVKEKWIIWVLMAFRLLPALSQRKNVMQTSAIKNLISKQFRCSYFVPVEPKPPFPRSVSSKESASSKAAVINGVSTSCAMRSPGSTVTASFPWL